MEVSVEAQTHERRLAAVHEGRRSERVFLRIPIEIVGKDAEGKEFREKTFTVVINRHGARISAQRSLFADQQITITNLHNGASCPFRVVGQAGRSLGEGAEWGVECLEPSVEIWGISFPGPAASPSEAERVDALLECSECQSRELAKLSVEEYHTLASSEVIHRRCWKCNQTTAWRFGAAEADTEAIPGSANGGAERRRARRHTVRLPVRVRLENGQTTTARTENLSRTGVCFVSEVAMEPGQLIQLTLGYGSGGHQEEVTAKVVWRRRIEGTNRLAYGVQLEGRD
jgi:hypothetical protein